MHFAATLPGRNLPEVLRLCISKGVDASLEVAGPQVSGTIWFKAGQVQFAQSSSTLALSEALLQLGILPETALPELRGDGVNAEDVLIAKFGVKPQVITYIRAFQIAETMYQMLEWDKAGFELKEGSEATPLRFVHPEFLPQGYDWLAELTQYHLEWANIRSKVGSARTVCKKGPNTAPDDLPPPERKLYDLVDGKRPLREIVLWSGMNFVNAHRTVVHLLDKLLITPLDGHRPGGRPMNEKGIQEVLRNVVRLPDARTALLVDRKGQLIAHVSADGTDEASSMASIFALTVGDFEQHLQVEEASRKIEQILVEHKTGVKTLLAVTHRVILAVEVAKECDWGLLRLEAGRALKSLWTHLGD